MHQNPAGTPIAARARRDGLTILVWVMVVWTTVSIGWPVARALVGAG